MYIEIASEVSGFLVRHFFHMKHVQQPSQPLEEKSKNNIAPRTTAGDISSLQVGILLFILFLMNHLQCSYAALPRGLLRSMLAHEAAAQH